MVKNQLLRRDINDPLVLEVMGKVPRHRFVDDEYANMAYSDGPLPIGQGQTISQPYIVAFMTAQLDPQPTDRVLEIGTGSGYQAAQYLEKMMAAETWATWGPALAATPHPRHVSANVAGVSQTRSLQHPVFDAAFGGATAFGVETFASGATRALNAMLTARDWLDPTAAGNPAMKMPMMGMHMGLPNLLTAIPGVDAGCSVMMKNLIKKKGVASIDELRELARLWLIKLPPGQTLQGTALVHEAYIRLIGAHKPQAWNSRGHFFVAAAEAMMRIRRNTQATS